MKGFAVVTFLYLIVSCRGPNEQIPFRAPGMQAPIITGVFITDETSPEPIGVIGNPTVGHLGRLLLSNPVFGPRIDPSQTDSSFATKRTLFSIPQTSVVSIWLVKGKYEGDDESLVQFSNAAMVSPEGLSIRTILNQETFPAGLHATNWRANDDFGRPLASGFYRLYLSNDDELVWRDLLIVQYPCDLPLYLRKTILNNFKDLGCY